MPLWPAHVPMALKWKLVVRQTIGEAAGDVIMRVQKVRVVRLWFEYFIPVGDFRSEGASSFNAENSCEEFVE